MFCLILNLLKKFHVNRLLKSCITELIAKFSVNESHRSRVEADLLSLKWCGAFILFNC